MTITQGFAPDSEVEQHSSKPSSLKPAYSIEAVQEKLLSHFSSLEDPRGKQGREHAFISIVLIAILGTLGGSQGWEDIETYGISHQQWLETFLDLRNGVPRADTYRRVFERLNPEALQRCFLSWIEHLLSEIGAQVISIDGKQVRGSYDREQKQSALHLVSAWASENRLLLGQMKVEEKSNEITAIPALLDLLDIAGCIITIDAMGTQTEIVKCIVAKQADYVLCLKANHPTLYNQVKDWFEVAQSKDFAGIEFSYDQRVESGHHRREIRSCWAIPVAQLGELYQQQQWAGIKTVLMVVRVRHLWNKTTREVQFYLSSLPCNAQRISQVIRQHWGIENQLHWVLDVTFGEDDSRIRRRNSPENFAVLRRMAITLLNRETSFRRSLKQKSRRAAMDNDYMLKVLSASSSSV